MGRFAFLYLTAFASLCFSTKQLHAQEQGIEKAAASSMEADHSGAVDGVSAVGSRQTNADKFKEKPSLLEEFFSSPLNYFLLLVVCLYVYLMFVQPRGVRQEKKLQLQRLVNLKKNDRVVTSAGIHGIDHMDA